MTEARADDAVRHDDLLHEPDVQSAFEIEQHGFDYIHEDGRYLRPKALASFWMGSNAYIIYMFIGGLVVSMGLSLLTAAILVVIATFGFLVVGYASVGGARSGLPTMTFTRAAFGVRGNWINTLLAWFELIAFEALNAIFGVFAVLAIFSQAGWKRSGHLGDVLATLIVIGVSALVAIYGHRLLFKAQAIFAVGLTIVLVLVAGFSIGKVDWSHGSSVHGGASVGVILAALAILVAGPWSFFPTCADYPRYLPTKTPARKIAGWTFAGAGSITLFLTLLGVALASAVDLSDPVAGVKPLIPAALFVPFAIAAAGGSIANNAITFYSSGLTLQAIGFPLRRWKATLVDCVLSAILVLYILLFNENLQTTISNFLALLNVWVGPFAAVWIADGLLRRWRYDPVGIHTISPRSPYWYKGGVNLRGLGSMAVGMLVGVLTINSPNLKGPVSGALWNGDLAWIAPGIAAGLTYWLIGRRAVAGEASETIDAPPALAVEVGE